MRKLSRFFLCGIATLPVFLLVKGYAHAALNNIDIGFLNPGYIAGSDIGSYIQTFYNFALGISGGLAMIMIVYGGIRYATSAGKPDVQNDAKDAIYSALFGVVLLFGAVILLRTVNPRLVELAKPYSTSTLPSTCASCQNTTTTICCVATTNSTLSRCMPTPDAGKVFKADCSGVEDKFKLCRNSEASSSSCPSKAYLANNFNSPVPPVSAGFLFPRCGTFLGIGEDCSLGFTSGNTFTNGAAAGITPPSLLWLYPYYPKGDERADLQTQLDKAQCVVYAYRNNPSSTASDIKTEKLNLAGLVPCPRY